MLNFTLKQLRYVEATGRLGSIARAAADLNISQSSITAAIDSLEMQIGYDLFIRTPAKGIRITPEGSETLRSIRRFIDQSNHFATEIQHETAAEDSVGSVRIACYATAAPSLLPPILKSFTQSHPHLKINLLEGNMQTLLTFLDEGEADMAFTYDQYIVSGRHDFELLFDAPPYALLPADDPLTAEASVSLADLSTRPMIMLDLPFTKDYFTGLFYQKGLEPNLVHSSRSAEIIRALVAGGYGFSILNICPPDHQKDDMLFRVMPIRDALTVPHFGIATLSGVRQPQMVKAFIEKCLELQNNGIFDDLVISN